MPASSHADEDVKVFSMRHVDQRMDTEKLSMVHMSSTRIEQAKVVEFRTEAAVEVVHCYSTLSAVTPRWHFGNC